MCYMNCFNPKSENCQQCRHLTLKQAQAVQTELEEKAKAPVKKPLFKKGKS